MTEETIFLAAMEKTDPAERAAYLDAACAGQPAADISPRRAFLRRSALDLSESCALWCS